MIKGIWALFSLPIFIFMAGKCHVHNHPGVLNIVNIDILLRRICRVANNCVQRVFEKNFYFIMIFLHFQLF